MIRRTAVFLIPVIAKIIPEQLPDPVYVAGFFPLSPSSYHVAPHVAYVLLHLEQQTSARRRYPQLQILNF